MLLLVGVLCLILSFYAFRQFSEPSAFSGDGPFRRGMQKAKEREAEIRAAKEAKSKR
jgi:hypothetical protein